MVGYLQTCTQCREMQFEKGFQSKKINTYLDIDQGKSTVHTYENAITYQIDNHLSPAHKYIMDNLQKIILNGVS